MFAIFYGTSVFKTLFIYFFLKTNAIKSFDFKEIYYNM